MSGQPLIDNSNQCLLRLRRRTEVRTNIEFNKVWGAVSKSFCSKYTAVGILKRSDCSSFRILPNGCAVVKVVSTRHIRKVSTVRLLKKTKIYFQNIFLSDSRYLRLLFHSVSTIIKPFIIRGHQFQYPLLVERGRLRPQTAGRSAARHARYHELRILDTDSATVLFAHVFRVLLYLRLVVFFLQCDTKYVF
jgi:hypothetical protein